MPTAKILLRPYQKKKEGTYPIVLRLYDGRDVKFQFTPYAVRKDQFQDVKGKWVIKHPDAVLINGKLADILAGADPESIRSRRVIDYLELRAKNYDELSQPDTALKLRRHVVEIEEMGCKSITFEKVNSDWVRLYRAHLVKVHGNGTNTIIHKLGVLRRIYRQAMKDGWAKGPNPFEDLALKKEPVDRKKLTIDELHRIEDIQLTPGSVLDQARDAFLFAFYAHGMRFQNIFTLEWSMIYRNTLRYQMNKGKKFREIKLHPKAVAILKKYKRKNGRWVFPFCKREWKDQKDLEQMKGSANALLNAGLKTVARLAEVHKPISMHIARHSFAYLLKKKGIDQHIIKDALGHSRMDTTEQYLDSLDDDLINKTVNSAFS